ncbi:hypothetical protein HFP43_14895 [Streptomyces sp. SJ1-7]|nr:hypothetical protein [Streptomyces sp. SJ1-7]
MSRSHGRRTVPTRPPPSAVITAAGPSRPTRAAMSALSHASSTRRTSSACPDPGGRSGAGAPRARRRAEAASCLQAAEARPRTTATSAKA